MFLSLRMFACKENCVLVTVISCAILCPSLALVAWMYRDSTLKWLRNKWPSQTLTATNNNNNNDNNNNNANHSTTSTRERSTSVNTPATESFSASKLKSILSEWDRTQNATCAQEWKVGDDFQKNRRSHLNQFTLLSFFH